MQKNSLLNKIYVIILTVTMLTGIFSNPAMAAIDTTKYNSVEQNQEILEILKGIFGDEAEAQAILETMKRFGLFDENGDLTSAGVEVDGRILTIDEIRELVNSEDVDLSKVVSVDGTNLTLGNLKIMIEIEDELRRIKNTYFRDDVSLNEEQLVALSSIRRQIEDEGIELITSTSPSTFSMMSSLLDTIDVPSGIDHTIYAIVDTTSVTCNNGCGAQSDATVTLKDSTGNTLTQVPNYDIIIPYRFVDGSAKNGTNYSGSNGTLTFTAGSGETTKAVPFNVNNDTSRYNGEKAFLIQFFEPQNIFFAGNMLASEIVVKIVKPYTWKTTVNVVRESWFNYLTNYNGRLGVYDEYSIANSDDMSLLLEEGIFSAVKVVFSHDSDTFEAGNYYGHVSLGHYFFPDNDLDIIDFNIGRIQKGKVTTYDTKNNPSFVLHPERLYQTKTGYQANQRRNGGNCWFDVNPDELTIPAHYPITFNYKFDITFYDAKKPSVKSVTIPQGTSFQYGESVPIIAEFSEPVNLANVRMTVNGQTLFPMENGNGVRNATFLYPIRQREDGSASLAITDITGGVDLSGYSQEAYGGTTLTFGLDELSKYYSFSTSTSADAVADVDFNITCTVDLPISSNDFTRWIDNERISDETVGAYLVKSVYASVDSGVTRIPLYCVESSYDGSLVSLRGTFTPELNTSGADVTRTVEFYYTDDSYDDPDAEYKNMVGKYATYTVPPVVFLDEGDFEISDSFPEDGIVFLQEGVSFRLEYDVNKPGATWKALKDFTWSSSNTAVATINDEGLISFSGQPTGSTPLYFTLTAKNGGVAGKSVSVYSSPLTVKVGLTPFLSIPEGTNRISIRSGENAEVRWTSNLIAKYAESNQDAVFKVTTFPAVYDAEGNPSRGDDAVNEQYVTGNSANPVASCFIPASVLNGISVIGKYSYIVEVSAVNPYKPSETLKAEAYISIDSKPAVVILQKLESYFITDAVDSVNISWSLENYDTINKPEFALEIMDNSDGSIVWSQAYTQDEGGSYNLTIEDVDSGFKDVYTVTVKSRNSVDSTWSYDSFVLHVYSDSAMRIWIDGVTAGQTLDMSNIERISKMTSEQILALNRDIYLKHVISINYGDYTWGQISDQIKWSSSDSNVASINFKEVSTYSSIENLKYNSYRPTDTFIMSGLNNGQTLIIATHAATNKTQTIDVRVDTLKDKLYLFQMSPKAKTTLSYINGKGEKCTVDTNDNGELALYEESGIKSEIHMKSSHGDKEYIGTLYKMVSSEKDYTKLELYPVNYFKLREISTAELYFKKPDGSVFSGDVILRGGVYKNGQYCADAKLNNKIGTEDQIITIGADGKFTVKMDPYQFWVKSNDEVLNASDDLEFVFEVRFPDDEYYPRLLDVNCRIGYEDAIKFGNKTVRVEEVPAGSKDKPFTVTQYIDYGFKSGARMDVLKFNGKVGPGQTSEEAKLITTVFWWGEDLSIDNTKHSITLRDEYGTVPKGQTSGSVIYPFSTIKATRNTFVMNKNTMNGWLESGERRGMEMVETDVDGNQYKVVTLPFSIINMIGMEKVEESNEINGWYGSISDFFDADAGEMSIGDKVIQAGLDFMCKLSIDKEDTDGMFSIALSPTTDPTVFTAFICLNLGNMSNDNTTGIYAEESIDSDLDYTPGLSDIKAMQKGKYTEKTKKKYKDNSSKKKHGNGSVHYAIGGYMEADVRYNEEKDEWEFTVLNGGFNAGGGYSYSWNYNTVVGVVPVTGQFTVGGTAEVIFKSVTQRGEDIKELYNKSSVNNYLTTLRLYAYMRAFAGLGFDYSVVALKIGLFGQISFDAQFAFLDQPYISKTTKGQKISVDGKVGIEFVAKFAFVSYEKVLASADFNLVEKKYQDWDKVQNTWKDINKKESEKRKGEEEYGFTVSPIRYLSAPMLYPVSSNVVIEKRDYLSKFERSWNEVVGTRGLLRSFGLSTDEVKLLETNSYPYSNPVLTKDGQIMLYVSDGDSTDIEDTEVRWTKMTGGSYPNGEAVETSSGGYGDSQLKLTGDQSFASAVWVRQSKKIDKDAGDPVTSADIAIISNSTEIMAAIYNGTGWTSTQLTDNAAPDIAPAVATNGKYVLAAWRNVYAADSRDPLNFSSSDTILYKIYNKDTGIWSDPQTLYNGTSGAVRGLEASMLEDGTSAIAYTIDANDIDVTGNADPEAVKSSLETVCAVVDRDGSIVKNVRYTNDLYLDENPQITTVTFDDGIERFVLGWYSEHDADGIKVNDIRLCAFDNRGVLYNKFIESINSVNANAEVNISRNFRFVNNASSVDELSIMWTETQNAHITEDSEFAADKDLLKAVMFREEDRYIYITAPLEVAEMDDYTLINHFSSYNAGDNKVKAVLLGTNYGGDYEERTIPVEENGVTTTKTIYVPTAVSNLYTAIGTYENNIGINYVAVDYTSVVRGMTIPVQFSVYNAGVEPIDSITLEIGGETVQYDEDFLLLPNESIILTAYYDVPEDKLVNPAYTVTARFEGDEMDEQTEVLYLDIPDVGISKLETLSDDNGKRVMQVTLYNNSDSILDGSGRDVRIGFYSDEDCTVPVVEVSGQESGEMFTVDAADLALIDAGAYTKQFSFDIGAHVGAGLEIPDKGVRLYAKVWIEEVVDPADVPGGIDTIVEYNAANNIRSVLFESLLRTYGDPVTISTEQTNEGGRTEAVVTLRNNSLSNNATGNLIVSLQDDSGSILESMQCYDPGEENNGLISLNGEGTARRVYSFSRSGASLAVSYSNAVLDEEDNAELASLSMTGIPLKLENGKTEYEVKVKDLEDTFISAVTSDPNASVTVNGKQADMGNITLNLRYGINKININVTAADGISLKKYTVTVTNTRTFFNDDSSSNQQKDDGTADSVVIVDIKDEEIARQINLAGNNGNRIIISPTFTGEEGKIEFNLNDTGISRIAASGAALSLNTPILNLNLSSDVIAELAAKGYKKISISIEISDGVLSVSFLADGKKLDSLKGNITARLPVPDRGRGTVAALINSNGEMDIIRMSAVRDGLLTVPLTGSAVFAIIDNAMDFIDTENHWAAEYIDFVTARNLFQGTGANRFDPGMSMTRGMIVTVLGRLSGIIPEEYSTTSFSDIKENAYYASYVQWAARNSIVQGVGNNRFSADQEVTREQLAVILYNYSQRMGLALAQVTDSTEPFADKNKISGYAWDAVTAMQRAGIINGKGANRFDPKGKASRAEVSAMLERFVSSIMW